jgi:competence protein ComEA
MVRSDLGDDDPVDLPDLSRLAGPPPRSSPADLLRRLALDLGLTPGAAALALALALALAAGAWWWWHDPPSSAVEAGIPLAAPVAGAGSTTTSAPASEVVAHAAGDVARPGVYTLATGSRVADLIDAAGGAGPEADLDRVNLAAPLGDGAQVHVPRIGEPAPVAPIGGEGATGGETALIDVNTAAAEELEALPGVGPATSAAIVRHRTENGPFAAVDDLISVSGIGDAKLAALRDLVTV